MSATFSPSDILNFFLKKNGEFTNRQGLAFKMVSQEFFVVSTPVVPPFEISISLPIRLQTKHYGITELLSDFQVTSLNAIKNKVSINDMYELYYSFGRGQIIVTLNDYLEPSTPELVEVYFEHVPQSDATKIYIPFLHYFEEVEETLYDEEEYILYILRHIDVLNWLFENKPKMELIKNLGTDGCRN